MKTPNDGGPAFPIPSVKWRNADGTESVALARDGMSLRDYFAAAALQGLLACPGIESTPERFAKSSYSCADAMLAERERKEAQP